MREDNASMNGPENGAATAAAGHAGMLPSERRAAGGLALIYACRMLGLFLIFPVFSLYAGDLDGATPLLVGLALGIYGLTQAALQIPFGMLSDRFGRKPVIAAGLLVFVLGSLVAAGADSIYGVVAGRALQGAGAVAAAIMALAADLSREEQRTKMMATMGMSIGLSFVVAMLAGPLLASWLDLSGLFAVTALLAALAIAVLYALVPTPRSSSRHRDTQASPGQFGALLRDPQLLRLDVGIFVLHLVITASFVAVPLALRDAGLSSTEHWQVYLPALIGSVAVMIPAIIYAEARRRMKPVFVAAVAGIVIAELALALLSGTIYGLFAALLLFFCAFNVLEASLPSLVSKLAPPDRKGSAMGIYSSSQFLGAFCGGLLGGGLFGAFGAGGVFYACALLALAWLGLAASMRQPPHLSSYLLRVGPQAGEAADRLADQLCAVPGVAEAVVVAEEGVAYLKVDKRALDEAALRRFGVNPAA